jgi:hypothetical protein
MVGDLDWDDNSEPKFRDTCDRILALWQTELEPIEQTVLKELQHRHFFTDLETQMLSLMEAKRLPPHTGAADKESGLAERTRPNRNTSVEMPTARVTPECNNS